MPDIKETITRPIGPLPAFAWVLVIVGGYFGYKFLSGRGSSTTSTTATTVGTSAGGVAPSSSDYANLTSQVSQLGNQITDLGSKITTLVPGGGQVISMPPVINPLPTPPPIVIQPPSTQPPAAAIISNFYVNTVGQIVDNLGNVYSGRTGSNSYSGPSGIGTYDPAGAGVGGTFTLPNGSVLTGMANKNAVDWWSKAWPAVANPGSPTVSNSHISASSLSIPATTPVN